MGDDPTGREISRAAAPTPRLPRPASVDHAPLDMGLAMAMMDSIARRVMDAGHTGSGSSGGESCRCRTPPELAPDGAHDAAIFAAVVDATGW